MSLTKADILHATMLALNSVPQRVEGNLYRYSYTISPTYYGSSPPYTFFPILTFGSGGGKVDWGDGTVSTYPGYRAYPSINHTYPGSGEYTIVIVGDIQSIEPCDPHVGSNPELISVHTKLPKSMSYKTTMARHFVGCTNLVSIPKGYFDVCKDTVTSFTDCFYQCYKLQSIPAGLFSGFSSVTSFYRCFYLCDLRSIPPDLFTGCVSAQSFYNCFYSNSRLAEIPAGLFNGCTGANNFSQCFLNCSGVISSVPELWVDYPDSSHSLCYGNCSNAANYADIPADWK